jgi:hypothetical protein
VEGFVLHLDVNYGRIWAGEEGIRSLELPRKKSSIVRAIEVVASKYDVQKSISNSMNVEGTIESEARFVSLSQSATDRVNKKLCNQTNRRRYTSTAP